MKRNRMLCAALLAMPALASATPLVTDKPVPWREATVKLGDPEARVRAVAGAYPDRVVTLYAGEGLPIGEQWMFIGEAQPKQLLWVELMRGRVTRVWTEPFGDGKLSATRAP